jgi:serine/threonine protein kinase
MGEGGEKKRFVIHPGKLEINYKNEPAKPISMRGRSLSFSAPVSRDIYSSFSESPAAKYLSEFTFKDDFYEVPDFEEGMVIQNYLLGQTLGGGVYSECREAYILNHKDASNIPDKVALKIITDPRYSSTFKREIKIWSRLKHPNILPLIDSFSGDGYMIAVSILAEKGNLHSFISNNEKISEVEAQKVFKQIICAVHYLHEEERIVHLDIKLENILLRKNFKVYLCDFGTCIKFGDSDVDNADILSCDNNHQFCSGSVTSLPPEIFSSSITSFNSFEMKKKQDIWALGIILYAMISGKLPFNDDFLPRLQHSIIAGDYKPLPDSICSDIKLLISKMLLKNPEERPSIQELMKHPWICM